jgi:hypothetical protein
MKLFGIENPQWKGGRVVTGGDYVGIRVGGKKNYELEHRIVAEKALGKPLPPQSIVHHHDENRKHNENSNLVICENRAYHALIHKRMRVLAMGLDPNHFKICPTCKQGRSKSDFHKHKGSDDGLNVQCRPCVLLKSAKRYERIKKSRLVA